MEKVTAQVRSIRASTKMKISDGGIFCDLSCSRQREAFATFDGRLESLMRALYESCAVPQGVLDITMGFKRKAVRYSNSRCSRWYHYYEFA